MFSKTLDSKPVYVDNDGNTVIDLTEGIFNGTYNVSSLHSIFKATRDCEVRPDYVSRCIYGDDIYTEMILKSSDIKNPFAIEVGDIIFSMRVDGIYDNVKDGFIDRGKTNIYDRIKNYHKYIDKNKVPDSPGSEINEITSSKDDTEKLYMEANISKTGNSGVNIRNGRIYFGENPTYENSISNYTNGENLTGGESALTTGAFGQKKNEEPVPDYEIGGNIKIDPDDGTLKFGIDDDIDEIMPKKLNMPSVNNIVINNGVVEFTDDNGDPLIDPELISPINSDQISCAKTGVSLGKLLSAAVQSNCTNKTE